jgi:glycosyltransferase involved in cell wall biosynthesis
MKIVMFSINPLFEDKVIGGSTKHLQNIAIRLGELDHEVTVLCTARPDTNIPFQWHDKVRVLPILKFKQPFPQPYEIPAYDWAANIQEIALHLSTADRFYMHDGEFLFPPVYQKIPTIISLRDNVYPETMLGSFLFQGDTLITISHYSSQICLNTAGRFLSELQERMLVIPNGLDWNQFKPRSPSNEIFNFIPINPEEHTIILHPHRPEPSKGLSQTVEVVDLLVNQYQIKNIKTLVPKWFDAKNSLEVKDYYEKIQLEIHQRGLANHFLFHEWVPQSLMPDYYNLGEVMLSLGHFVEAFGNTVYESLGCGTPAIAARIATHRELLPDNLVDKVHFNDQEQAAHLAAQILRAKKKTSEETMRYLHTHYDMEKQLAGYTNAILSATKKNQITYRFTPINENTRFKLAPWCYQWGEKYFYHDFLAKHETIELLSTLLSEFPDGFSSQEATKQEVAKNQVDSWYRQGYLVPVL